MANHDYIISNNTFPSTRTDINSVLQAIVSNNSSATEPATKYAYMMWYDTATDSWKMRNADNDDWIQLATFDQATNTVNFLDSTISSPLSVTGTATAGAEIRLPEDTDNGSNYVALKAPDTLASDVTFTLPSADGTTDQVLKTDGSGNLSFVDVSGGTDWQSSIVTASTLTAVSGNGYWINTTSNACTITLPASASVGDTIVFVDYTRTWGTNAVTINQNSLNFQGSTTPNPIYNTDGQSVTLTYSGATQGWIPTSDDAVTDETPPYLADFLVVAGGGSGKNYGGGGAGGYRNSFSTEASGGGGSSETELTFNSGTVYTITVGAGGAVTPSYSSGSSSSISGTGITTITSAGGGTDSIGGSGGGAVVWNTNGFSGTANQGYAGGNGRQSGPPYSGGGGGGASAVGTQGGASKAGNGGNGVASSITGSSITRAGGGGGGVFQPNGATQGGNGGSGGGGYGGAWGGTAPNNYFGQAGTANTGGAGGGGDSTTGSANGGSGVVILRMLDADYSGTTTGSPTVATGVGGTDTVLTFNASGSYTG